MKMQQAIHALNMWFQERNISTMIWQSSSIFKTPNPAARFCAMN